MAVSLKHLKTSFVSDSGDPSLVQGSDWNAEHNLTCASGVLLGRQTAGAGAAEEVPIADFWASPGAIGGTTPAAGTFTTLIGGKDAVNFQQIVGAATTKTPIHSVAGSDANIALALKSKGTGGIDLAAGSAGINISNGGTVTAVTRTATGSGYTTPPTWSATAPTTPGGVTASGSSTMLLAVAPTITSGGTGYSVNDVLTVSGGTSTASVTFSVTSVSGGVITGVSTTATGNYSVLPANPVSVTGGTGSGATFTLSWGINTPTITTAGSGYLEQPQITFSGGGGSGAAAYATVGSGTKVQSLGSTMSFYTPGGEGLRVNERAGATDYVSLAGGSSTTGGVYVGCAGTGTAPSLYLGAAGTGQVRFYTNSFAQLQLAVAHTASAVNYVQVTGGATTVGPIISAQGSDTNVQLDLRSKGSSSIFLRNAGGGTQLAVNTVGAGTNYLQVASGATTVAPVLSAQGTDTNINLALTPKGTGTVQFGTYTASVLSPTGYITITDSGGTTRRLLVG